eukprot:6782975-Prymnesium_polylepis.1
MRWAVCREKLSGCLRSARAGQRSPRGYMQNVAFVYELLTQRAHAVHRLFAGSDPVVSAPRASEPRVDSSKHGTVRYRASYRV